MSYVLDTDWVIDYLAGDAAAQVLLSSLQGELAISIITYSEVYEGILRSPTTQQREQGFRAFLRNVTVLPVSKTVAKRHAAVRLDLRQRGKSVRQRGFDLLIAATALTYQLTLVTRNRDDYTDVTGLVLY